MTDLLLVARVASASTSTHWEVKTDGQGLSCPCPGWTRQTHVATCAAATGRPCSCRHMPGDRTMRTCRHTREVGRRVQEAGGLAQVVNLIRRGGSIMSPGAVVQERTRTLGADSGAMVRAAVMVRRHGPDRVVMNAHGDATAYASRSMDPQVVFIRRDGWTLGAPLALAEVARRQWSDSWVGTMWRTPTGWSDPRPYEDVPVMPTCTRCGSRLPTHGGGAGDPVARACQRTECVRAELGRRACAYATCTRPQVRPGAGACRQHLDWAVQRGRAVAPVLPPSPAYQPAPEPPQAATAPDWMGGRRAIILRD